MNIVDYICSHPCLAWHGVMLFFIVKMSRVSRHPHKSPRLSDRALGAHKRNEIKARDQSKFVSHLVELRLASPSRPQHRSSASSNHFIFIWIAFFECNAIVAARWLISYISVSMNVGRQRNGLCAALSLSFCLFALIWRLHVLKWILFTHKIKLRAPAAGTTTSNEQRMTDALSCGVRSPASKKERELDLIESNLWCHTKFIIVLCLLLELRLKAETLATKQAHESWECDCGS